MTSAALLQRAAELVIAFGLTDADTTADKIRSDAADGDLLVVHWRSLSRTEHGPDIELMVLRRTGGRLDTRVYMAAWELAGAESAKRVLAFAGRVACLAAQIEALR